MSTKFTVCAEDVTAGVGKPLQGRYQIVGELGRGASAIVFEARDNLAKRSVALKVLTGVHDHLLFSEYRRLAALDHENLVNVYSLERLSDDVSLGPRETLSRGTPMVVLEYIEGVELLGVLESLSSSERDLRLRQVAQDLSAGLDAVHRAGVVHRDLKPDNVLIEAGSGRARIIDFGLAVEQGAATAVGGTLPYMAPEIIAGVELDHRVDLYALGATLFHIASGHPPFTGDATEVLRGIVSTTPSLEAEWLGEGLRKLILSLLAKDPQHRPSSAHAVLTELARLAGDHERVAALMETRTLVRAAFVGRKEERRELSELFDNVEGMQIVFVEGIAGSGKSRLIEAALSDHRLSATTQGRLPLALHRLSSVEHQGKASDEDVISACENVESAAVDRGVLVHFDGLDADDLQRRVFDGLIQTHSIGSSRQNICLLVETRQLGAWEEPEHGGRDRHHYTVLGLGPLSQTEVEAMIASMTGAAEKGQIEVIVQAALGNPRVVEELLFAGESPVDGKSASLGDLIRSRRDEMPSCARALLDAIALAEESLSEEVLFEVTRLDRQRFQQAVTQLMGRGLLVINSAGQHAFCSPSQAAAWRACIAEREDARNVHLALADVYYRDEGRDGGRDAEALSTKIKLALQLGYAEDSRAVPLLLDVGQAAIKLHQPQRVLGVFQALKGFITQANSAPLRLMEAEILVESGRYDDALAVLPEKDPNAATLRAKAFVRQGKFDAAAQALIADVSLNDYETVSIRGQICLRQGQAERAWSQVQAVVEDVCRNGQEHDAAAVLEVGGLAKFYRGDLGGADALFARVANTLSNAGEKSALTAGFLNLRGMVAFSGGKLVEANGYYTAAAELAEKHASQHALALYRGNLGGVALELGHYRQALIALTRASRDLGRMGRVTELVSVLCNLATLYVRLGDLDTGEKLRAESASLAKRGGNQQVLAYLAFLAGDIESKGERHRQATDCYAKAMKIFAGLGAKREQGLALLALGKSWVHSGEFHKVTTALKDELLAQFSPRETAELRVLLSLRAPAFFVDDTPSQIVEDLAKQCQHLEATGMIAELWRISALLAQILTFQGRHSDTARKALNIAKRNWERLMTEVPELFEEKMKNDPHAKNLADHWKSLIGEDVSPHERRGDADPRLRRLLAINKRLNSELRLPRLLELIIDTAIELSEAERGFLLLFEGNDTLAVKVARNIDQEALASEELQLSRSIAERAAKTGDPVVTVDAIDDGRFSAAISVDDLSLRSVLAVPLTVKGRSVGTIYVDHRLRKGLFGEDELALLMDLAQQAGIAIENARLLAENQERQREIETLNIQLAERVEQQEQALIQAQEEIRSNRQALQLRHEYSNIVGRTPVMQELFSLLDRVTDSELPVVLEGESGTGKELVARAIHYNGARADAPFVGENCGAIPESLLESVLFGHTRGAFTGANRDRKGLFSIADGGTLFLDEVGEMSPAMQTKLLRVLQGGDFRPVGSEVTRQTDVRVIAASNRDLREEVRAGRFREDLFYRINVVRIEVPALRKRREDIPVLVAHFLEKHAAGADRNVEKDALALLMGYGWPGNVRELENEVMRLCALAGETIRIADLSPHIGGGTALTLQDAGDLALKPRIEHLEKDLIERALNKTKNNHSRAAKLLGVSRYGLLKKLRRYYPERYQAKAG